jgi:hypothetical protein
MTWHALVEAHATAEGTQRGQAQALMLASGRPYATCYAAIRRYRPGKVARRLHQPCVRCAQIRRILGEQQH